MSCLLAATHNEGVAPDPFVLDVLNPLSNKPLMSLSLLPDPFFSLQAGQLQHLLGCSPAIDEPARETPGSTGMSGHKDREWKIVGVRVTAT